ncbi:MAG: hypothetical protein Q4E60_04890, partial [Bacteroidales bacterium]|nr:hypothetical protein [Bacteroidales bacterium]
MKYKSLIINSDEWKKQFLLGCGCCFWNHWNYDEYEGRSIIRKESEKWLSEKFNNIARMGYKLLDERIKRHDYYEQNVYEGHSYHGVYRFEKNLGTPEEYYVYLGPLLNIDKMGCGSIGCG